MANYLKILKNLDHWDLYYQRGLSLIQDPKWRGETWENKAEGDLALKKREIAAQDLFQASLEYQQADMLKESWKMAQRASSLDSDISIRNRILHPTTK
jgi:hypothetical protein